jgi:hypothetical protein
MWVTFEDAPYAVDDTLMAKWLLFDATGALAAQGEAEAVEDGYWQITVSADVTGALEAGSNQLAAIYVSKRALVPIFETYQFVTQ